MFTDSLTLFNQMALKKKGLLDQSIARYLMSAGLAGAYVGMGIILIVSIGGPLLSASSPLTTMLMGMSFGIALSLVIFAGSELFTSNNMIFVISSLSGTTSWRDTARVWSWCYLGNFAGAILLVLLIMGSGLFSHITPDHVLMKLADKKMNAETMELFFRGILCNWLVCLSVWTAMRTKNDAAKLILIFWCLFAFIASGYEHSVANMTLLSLSLMLPHPETISLAGLGHNLLPVTLGNIVGGGVFLGMVYWLISPHRVKKADKNEEFSSEPISIQPITIKQAE